MCQGTEVGTRSLGTPSKSQLGLHELCDKVQGARGGGETALKCEVTKPQAQEQQLLTLPEQEGVGWGWG